MTIDANKSDLVVIELRLRNSGVDVLQDLRYSVREMREIS